MDIDAENVPPPVRIVTQATMRRLRLSAKDFVNRSDWRGAIAISTDWIIVVLCVMTYPLFGLLDSWLSIPIYLCAAVVLASRFRGVENLVHEAAHYNLFATRELNDQLECLFAIPIFRQVSDYRRVHVIHHQHLGDITLDPDIQRYERLGINKLPDNYLWIMFIRPLMGFHTVEYVQTTLRDFCVSKASRRSKLFFWLGAAGLLLVTGAWQLALLYWLLPFFVLLPIMRFWAESAEHAALDLTHEIASSRTNIGWLHRLILYPHEDGHHEAHHLYPAIPWYELPRAHRALMSDADFERYCVESHSVFSTFKQLQAPTTLTTSATEKRAQSRSDTAAGNDRELKRKNNERRLNNDMDKPEDASPKRLRAEEIRIAFIVTLVGMPLLIGAYLLVWALKPIDPLMIAAREFILAILLNIFPIAFLFAVSYIVVRRLRDVRAAQEQRELLDQLKTFIHIAIESCFKTHAAPCMIVYANWHDPRISEAIANARKKVEVVRGSGCDATQLMLDLQKASEKALDGIELNVYMLDPNGFYGPARVAELKKIPMSELESGRKIFRTSADEYRYKLELLSTGHPQLKLSIHTFDALPVLRMTVIDDEFIIFSWFPGGKDAADNSCFGIRKHPLHPENDRAFDDLLEQLKYIKRIAQATNKHECEAA
jgi:fatty acid desaturase